MPDEVLPELEILKRMDGICTALGRTYEAMKAEHDKLPASSAGNIFLDGEMDHDRFLPMLGTWFHDERVALSKLPLQFPKKSTLFMGVAVWGRKFIDNFFNYCVPTLLAPCNIQALTGRTVLAVHVDARNFEYMKGKLKRLEDFGIAIEIYIIPQHLIDMVPQRQTNKYWLLGTIQHFYLLEAAHRGMNFHMLMPDHIYSSEFFPNLLKLSKDHEAIISSSINGNLEKCTKILENYRFSEFICIDAIGLATLGFENLHEGIKPCIMNGRDAMKDIPVSNYIIWRGKDRFYTYSPHASLLYLSNRLLRHITIRIHNALDTQIPYYVPMDEEIYKPKPEDGVVYIELTEGTKEFATQSVGFLEFCFRYWVLTHFNRDFERIYRQPNIFPLEAAA